MDNNNNYNQEPVPEQQPNNQQQEQQQQQQQQQQAYYQPQQQQPYYQPNHAPLNAGNEPPMTLGDWIITLIVLAIPCINVIMIFVWGFGSGVNTSKKNYCRAVLIFMLIGIVLSLLLSTALLGILRSVLNNFY